MVYIVQRIYVNRHVLWNEYGYTYRSIFMCLQVVVSLAMFQSPPNSCVDGYRQVTGRTSLSPYLELV